MVASTLWNRFETMEPPAGLLQKVQSIEVNLWDNTGYHRVYFTFTCQRAGGHWLVHLGSRAEDFRHSSSNGTSQGVMTWSGNQQQVSY